MLAAGVVSAWKLPEVRPGERDPNPMDLGDSAVGAVGPRLLAAFAAWFVRRLANRRDTFQRVATAPAPTATLLGIYALTACGAVAARIT